MNHFELVDTTLRDGEQRPGLYFTRQQKLDLARALDQAGFVWIEAGIPSMGAAEIRTLEMMGALGLKAKLFTWNRLKISDLEAAYQTGIPRVHVSVPTSDLLLEKKLRKTRDWVRSEIPRVLGWAAAHSLEISVGAEDASRTDPGFLKEILHMAQEEGAQSVRYADTLGILHSSRIARELPEVLDGLKIPLEFHGHNDLGMATANSLAALEAGAQRVSGTVLGLGERSGNAALEEVAAAIHFTGLGECDLNWTELKNAWVLLSRIIKVPVDGHKAIAGGEIFSEESGIHVDGLLKDPRTYWPFPPDFFKHLPQIRVGKHSGRAALIHLAKVQGVEIDQDEAGSFLSELREKMALDSKIDAAGEFQKFLKSQGKGVV